MTKDLDTVLTALYVHVDDHVAQTHSRRPGRPKKLTDAELICLAVAQVLLGFPSQHHWLRFCFARLGTLFPYLPHQPGYNKRINAAGPLIAATIEQLAAQVSATSDQFRFIDATPIPCGTSVPTVKRSALAGFANYGYCTALSRWYWGVKLYLITTAHGMPIAWCLADPKIGEREVAAELIGHAHDRAMLPPDCTLIGDKGLAGKEFHRMAALEGVHFVRPDRKGEPHRSGNLGGIRQLIESVYDTCKGQLSLEAHGARTRAGLFARTAQRLLALAAAIWHNLTTNAPTSRSLTAYDH
ncbi:IS982 family transposase [Nocardia sp. NPDC050793]|uniref:IS982 family transposase n=1 Tax=Nocardia sp. NPDC050793 TaxID=3155159 RepID=UPI0033CD36C6